MRGGGHMSLLLVAGGLLLRAHSGQLCSVSFLPSQPSTVASLTNPAGLQSLGTFLGIRPLKAGFAYYINNRTFAAFSA